MRRRAAEAGINAKAFESCRAFVWLAGVAASAAVGYWVLYWFGLHAWSGAVLGAAAWVGWGPCDD